MRSYLSLLDLSRPRSLALVLASALVPWLLVILASSPWWHAPLFLALMAVQCGVGYLVLKLALRLDRYPSLLLLVPGAGYVFEGATIAFGVRLGSPATLMFWVCLVLGVFGFGLLFKRLRRQLSRQFVIRGYCYFLLSVVVCSIYFVPAAFRDAVVLPNGAFQWMYIDTQYLMASAVSVKIADDKPKMPGMHEAEFKYHFGAYAIAGALSASLPISAADAFARVLRGLAQFTVMISSLGLGVILVRIARLPLAAALGSPILFFFYGSLSALLVPVNNSATEFNKAILFNMPELSVTASGGPFAHLLLCHSTLHGMIGLILILALAASLLAPRKLWLSPFSAATALMAAPTVALNSIAGMSSAGLLAAAFIIRAPITLRSWVLALVTLSAAAATFALMGFLSAEAATMMHISPTFYEELPQIITWFVVGLGVRAVLFSDAMALYPLGIRIVVALVTCGFVGLTLVFHDPYWGDDHYGLYFAQATLSLLAGPLLLTLFPPLSAGTGGIVNAALLLLQGTRRIALPFAVVAALGLTISATVGSNSSIELTYGFKVALALAFFATVASVFGVYMLKWNRIRLQKFLGGAVVTVYAVGFLAWLPAWLNFGFDRAQFTVQLSPAVTNNLSSLVPRIDPDALIATNKESISTIPTRPERSYGYFALLERQVLLEGWRYGELFHPLFSEIKQDNATLFSTKNEEKFKTIVDRYGIDYVIAMPDTDISLAPPYPIWLHRIPDIGIAVYKVVRD